MKFLAIVRHGEFDEGESTLNREGRAQMVDIAQELVRLKPLIFSSVGPRAIESAEILAHVLGAHSDSKEYFGSNTRLNEAASFPEAYDMLSASEDNVVIVTKGEWARDFIPYFCRKTFGADIAPVELERGEGVLIDIPGEKMTSIP